MLETPSFDVLNRHLNVHQHLLLEASAGTGKTFSIENIVVRLLIETPPHQPVPRTLERLLIMTFTRAAARDLKMRIRANIQNALTHLQYPSQPPDYLLKVIEMGEGAIDKAKTCLENALFNFDQAQIYTIHSFCNRMLRNFVFEGDLSLDLSGGEHPLPKELFKRGIRDFFHTGLTSEQYGKIQMVLLAKAYGHNQEDLENELLKVLQRRGAIAASASFSELYLQFCEKFTLFKQFIPDKILEDFYTLIPFLNKVEGRFAEECVPLVKQLIDILSLAIPSQDHFEQIIANAPLLLSLFDPESRNKRKKGPEKPLHYPDLARDLKIFLAPALEAGNTHLITVRLAADCQKHLQTVLKEEECFGPDDLLTAMQRAVHQAEFTEHVRALYDTVIIDEFQDTDPIQWDIIQTLFLREFKGHLMLVGDPKQSIYAFRQADIYTYLAAAEALGPQAKATLDTNYRSQTPLLQALNTLFSKASSFMSLPRTSAFLPYRPVCAGSKTIKTFNDPWGCVHFMRVHYPKKFSRDDLESQILPFIAGEIQRLISKDFISPREIAVLVNDRYQAQNTLQILKQWNIPAQLQRQVLLADSPAVDLLKELLQATLSPRDESALKTALGGPLIGWTHLELERLKEEIELQTVLLQFYELRRLLIEQNFGTFFYAFLHTVFGREISTEEALLKRDGGLELYQDLLHLAEIAMTYQSTSRATPEELLQWISSFKQTRVDEETSIKKRRDVDQEAVQILTIHSSKGLEFDCVFALGLMNPLRLPDLLIPNEKGDAWHAVRESDDPLYQRFSKEHEAESMRQLYVAMTRARLRLYIPLALGPQKTTSPIDCFLEKLPPLDSFLSTSITVSDLSPLQPPIKSASFPTPPLIPPLAFQIPCERSYMFSYSSLAKGHARELKEMQQEPPHDFQAELRNVHTLPSGSDVGNLLHGFLEIAPFDKPLESAIIAEQLQHTPFHSWSSVLQKMLETAFNTPLPLKTGWISLKNVSPQKAYREMNFMFPWDEELILPETEKLPGFLKGVIDLIFEHDGFYYLADWKSNWLGPDTTFYTPSHLQNAMFENGYYLQAEVYREALRRYLALFDDRPFEELYGGMFYLFLRGLDPEKPGLGIYHGK